jgi:DNA-binding NarL/FixJ family response regulator
MPVVWLIEDNRAFRRATERALRARSDVQQPRAFERCEAALEELQAGHRPEVVLMDVGLPGMDGIEGIRRFKALAPEVAIVLLTMFEDDDRIFQAICAGASGYLLKSEPMQRVMQAIDQALVGGSPMNPRVARKVLDMFTRLTGAQTGQNDYGLNPREQMALELMAKGFAKKQIADQLNLNPHTADYTIRCVYRKLHVRCVAAAVSVALKNRLVPSAPEFTRSRNLPD